MDFLLASHRIGRIFNINVFIAYSLYLVTGLFALSYASYGYFAVIGVVLLPIFVLLHELGHSMAAISFGLRVQKIVLYIIGGVAQLEGMIPGAKAEIIIAIMGPAVSFFLSAIFGALFIAFSNTPIASLFYYCSMTNLMLGLFNLLPIFPLDGGRVALAIAVLKVGPARATSYIKPMSVAGAIILGCVGVFQLISGNGGGIFLILIAVFIYIKGGQELQARSYLSMYADYSPYNQGYGGYSQSSYTTNSSNSVNNEPGFIGKWLNKRKEDAAKKKQEQNEELTRRVDEVLAKVKNEGIASLTPGEKALLQKASNKYNKQ